MICKTKNQLLITSFLVLVIILNCTLLMHENSADWIITESEVDYVLDESNWLVEYNGFSISANGGFYNGLMFKENGLFTVEVIDIDEIWGVDYKVDNTTHNTNDYITSDKFYFEFLRFLYNPLDESKRLAVEGIDESRIKKGPALIPWFFIEPTEQTWDYLINMSDINFHNTLPIVKDISGSMRADFVRAGSEATFDIVIQGTLENDTTDINLEFDHTLKFVWNEITGVLLGYRISSYFNGRYFGNTITEQISIVCRQVDYALDRFKFLSGFIPGFTFFISIIGLVALAMSIVLIRKRRKKIN